MPKDIFNFYTSGKISEQAYQAAKEAENEYYGKMVFQMSNAIETMFERLLNYEEVEIYLGNKKVIVQAVEQG